MSFWNGPHFSDYLLKWEIRPPIHKTWIQFKVDFRQTVWDLEDTGNLQVCSLHHNVLRSNLMQDVRDVIKETVTPLLQVPKDLSPAPNLNLNTAQDTTIHQLQGQLQQMQQTMLQMQTAMVVNNGEVGRDSATRGRTTITTLTMRPTTSTTMSTTTTTNANKILGIFPLTAAATTTATLHKTTTMITTATTTDVLTLSKAKHQIHSPNIKESCKALTFQHKQFTSTHLTHLPLQKVLTITNYKLNVINHKDKTKLEFSQILQAACFSPDKSTLISTVRKGNFISWPGLTQNLIKNTAFRLHR